MNLKKARLVFMGTPDYSVPTLDMLINEGYNIVLVITNPDKRSGRGKKVHSCPVKIKAVENKLDILQPKTLKTDDFYQDIKKYNPELYVTIAYGKIIPKRVIDLPKYGCVNVHASLLPKYRGAAPIWRTIMNGETESGVTTMFSDAGIDTGKMLLQKKVKITHDMTTGELHDILAKLSPVVLKETLEGLSENKIKPIEQDHSKATYAHKISKEDGKIDWNKAAEDIRNLIRGTNPWPGAYTFLKEKRIKIFKSKKVITEKTNNPGEILKVNKKGFTVACKQNALEILEIQAPGCRKMNCCDYLCGNEIKEGTILK